MERKRRFFLILRVFLGVAWVGLQAAQASTPPGISGQPASRVVIVGSSYTFSVTATGTSPLYYQWRFNGAAQSGQTNSSLLLTNIQTSNAGNYLVVITNTAGAVTSSPAVLVVHGTNDPVYPAPAGGWAYLFTGDGASNSLTAGLDGTWNHQNSDDAWDGLGRGVGNGLPGGVGTTNGILTIEDDVTSSSGGRDNRLYYLTHDLTQESSVTNGSTLLNDGVTLTFRARLTPPAPADPMTELTNAPNGFVNVNAGKGMFGIRHAGSGGAGGMLISFSLNQAVEDLSPSTSFNFGQAGLHMNNLNGDSRSPNVDPGAGGITNLLPLDSTIFHEFWITIQDNGAAAGTHAVSIYVDGSKTPTVFNLTAGVGNEGITPTNYVALGLPSTAQAGAVDVDFYGYKPGVLSPANFNDPVGILVQPANQTIAAGQAAIFNVGVTGAPPYSFQWYKNGLAINQATNASYTTPLVTPADDGSAFTVVVANLLNSVTSSPPAILHLLLPPVILTQPQSQTVNYGDAVAFSVTAQSEVAVTYRWQFNGANVAGETNAALSIPFARQTNAGAYDVIITNNGGAVTSVVATLTVNSWDFGDAPAPYPTLLANNGARHLVVPGIYLGSSVDFEVDGQPNATATGDDLGGIDDEDGVTFLTVLFAGSTGTVQVVASTNGLLNAWIDCNGNGSWADAGEHIFIDRPLVTGTNLLSLLVPPGTTATSTFARFRFSTAGGLSFDGPAPDGEVEDYGVSIVPVADLMVRTLPSSNPAAANSNLVYSIIVTNGGPSTASGVNLTNAFSGTFNFVSASSSQGSCVIAGSTVTCALGSLSASNSATVTITVVPTAAGSLSGTASVGGNQTDFFLANNIASTNVTVEVSPSIISQPVSLIVTQGNNVTLSVSASGSAPLLYQWHLNGLDLSGQTNATFLIGHAQTSDAGTYTVRVRNPVGNVLSAPATLTVLVPPSITAQPQSQTNLAGGMAALSVTATGTAPLSYEWRFNQTNILTGATNSVLALTNVQKVQSGDYTVTVRNSAGSASSQTATLTILEMDFGDAPDPPYPTLLANNGARHRIVPGFYLGAGVDFEPDGQPNATGTGDDLNGSADEDGVKFLTPLYAGQLAGISVVASTNGLLNAWMDFHGNGSWADAGDQIFTNKPLAAGSNFLSFSVPAPVPTTNGFARFRFSSAANLSFVGEAPDGEVEDYAVSLNAAADLALSVSAQPNPVAVGSNLTYTILVTNRGPSAASGVTVTELLPSNVNFISVVSGGGSCANSGSTVTCSLGSLAAGGSVAITIVCVPSAAGSLSDSATVTALEHELNPLDNSATTAVMAQDYPVIITPPQSLAVIVGNSAGLSVSANGTSLNYQWRLNGNDLAGETNSTLSIASVQLTQAGDYRVLVSNGVGAQLSDVATLTVLELPRILVPPQSQTQLAGSDILLSVTAAGTAPLIYQWRFDDVDLPGETNSTLHLSAFQQSEAGAYTVRVSNPAGSVLSDPPAVLVVLIPPGIAQQPQTHTDNAGGQSVLSVVATGTDPLSYQWYYADAGSGGIYQPLQVPSAALATLVLTNVQASQSGSYFVVVTNAGGVITSAVAVLTIVEMDFGDAPDSLGYPTSLIYNGARHRIVPGIHLGAAVDFEPDGQPNDTATGDDINGINDDDGVVFTSPILVGQVVTVDVIASTNGFLDAWMDFDRSGDWDQLNEQIFASQLLSAGTNHLSFSVPAQAMASNTFARFRFSTAGGLPIDGPAADGEVEDYQVTITPAVDLGLAILDVPDPVVAQSNLTYTLTVSNRGPSTATTVMVQDQLPAGVGLVSVTASQGTCISSGGSVSCQLGALPGGSQASITVMVAPAHPGLLTNVASVTAHELDLNPADNTASATSTAIAVAPPFVNAGYIDVLDVSPANPYPSTIFVSGLTATVYRVTATLSNLTHAYPADLEILLVGPQGQSVILMSDAGTRPIQNVTLTFDDTSELSLPERGGIISQRFKPTNYDSPDDPDLFPAPAPPPPYGAQLSVFAGTDPNGIWSLYVVDDSMLATGFINNGWSLNISTINPIADLSVGSSMAPDPAAVGSNLTCIITVTNQGPAAATGISLIDQWLSPVSLVSAVSSQGSCSNANGLLTCSLGSLPVGGSATVTVMVAPAMAGLLTNTASVSCDGVDFTPASNLASAIATVRAVTDLGLAGFSTPDPAPLFQDVACTWSVTNRGPNTATSVRLTSTPLDGLDFISVSTSQGTCAYTGGTVVCDLGDLGSGSSASVTITATANRRGTITNAATVTSYEFDSNFADNVATQATAVVVVSPTFSNPTALTILSGAAADVYPSVIQVSGVTAAVYQVTATLSNLSHPFPEDLNILLVGPAGQGSLLMSHAGGNQAISGVTLLVADSAAAPLPDFGPLVSGFFKPSSFAPLNPVFPTPAPVGPFETRLSVFRDTDPNGPWLLYIFSDGAHGSGTLGDGWGLTFAGLDPIADLSLGMMAAPDPSAAGSNFTYTLSVTNLGPAGATGIMLSDPLPAGLNFVAALASQGSCLNDQGTITCTLGSLPAGSNATVTVVVSSILAGTLTNSASVTGLETDLNPANNAATLISSVQDPPAILLQPQSQTRTNGDSVFFGVSATGAEPFQYLWQHNNTDLLDATNATLGLDNLTLADGGTYRVRVSNPVGSVLSDPATLTVLSRPNISAVPDLVTNEDNAASISFSVDDVETPAGALLVAASSSNPILLPNANLILSGSENSRTLTLLPATNQFGTAVITLTVTDGDGIPASTSFLLTVLSVNDLPTISPIQDQAVDEDTPIGPIPFVVDDVETPAASLLVSVHSSNPALVPETNIVLGGSGANRTVFLTPAADQSGTATVTLTVTDGDGASVSTSFGVTVTPVNDPPTLDAIANLTIDEDSGEHVITLTGISSGATNEIQTLTLNVTSSDPSIIPTPALSYSNPDRTGSLRFTPTTNASGIVSINVTVNDGGSSNNLVTRSFTVTVNSVNDLPFISGIDDEVIDADSAIGPIPFTVGDVETAPGNLIVSGASSNPSLVSAAGITFGGSGANRTVTVTPLTTRFGSAILTVTVLDADGGTAATSFMLTVNPVSEPPTLDAISDLTINEDAGPQTVNLTGISSGATNQNPPLTVTAITSNPALLNNLAVSYSNPATNGVLSFTPAPNAFGTAVITIAVDNGQSQNSSIMRSFTVSVSPVNDLPTLDAIANLTINSDAGQQMVILTGISSGATNENEALNVSAVSDHPELIPNPTVAYTSPNGFAELRFTPHPGSNGVAALSVTVNDGQPSNNIVTRIFQVTVLRGNHPPIISSLPDQTINEDTSAGAIAFTVGDAETPAGNLSVTSSSSNPGLTPGSSFSFGGNGTNRTVTILPATNQFGTAIITLTVTDTDGGATSTSFLLTVNPVNDPPTISSIASLTINEDTPISVPFTIGDAETATYALTVTASSSNPTVVPVANILPDGYGSNRVVNITPAPNLSGVTTITLTVSDGSATASSFFVLTVNAVNDLPTLDPLPPLFSKSDPRTLTVNLTGITSGATNESQTLSVTASTTNAAFYSNAPAVTYTSPSTSGTLTLRPTNTAYGASSVTVTVSDGTNTFSRSFPVYIKSTSNAAPTAVGISSQTVNENTSTAALPFTIGDTVTPANLLGVLATSSNPDLVPTSNIFFGGVGSNRTVTVTPAANRFGSATLTISVMDTNYAGTNFSFLLTVNSLNNAPVLSTIANQTINGNSTGLIPFTVGDVETAAANLAVGAVSTNLSLVPNANLVLGGSGTNRVLIVTPATNQFGTTLITLTVSDGVSNRSTSFLLTVAAVNNPPTISALANQTINEDTPTAALAFTVGDLETAAGSLSVSGASSNPALVPTGNIVFGGSGANRTVTIVPLPDQFGTAVITVSVSDGVGASSSTSFRLTVNPVNDPPTLNPIHNLTLNEDAGPQYVVLGGVSSGATNEIQTLTITATNNNPALITNLTVSYLNPETAGILTFATAPNADGAATITVTVNDGGGSNNLVSQTFTVTVLPVNHPPVLSDIPDQVTGEDTPTGLIPFSIDDTETPGNSLVVGVVSLNSSLLPAANIMLGGSGNNRTLTLLPAAHQSGTALLVVSVSDGASTTSKTFTLTVNPVNDPPTLDAIGDLTLAESSPPQSVALTGITSGPSDGNQRLTVTALSSNPELIPNPAIRYFSSGRMGTMNLAPVPKSYGSAVITVTVQDDGGRLNGGRDSFSRAFRVTVPAPMAPSLVISQAGPPFQISFPTETGQSYVIEYRDSLADPVWSPLTTVTGTGQVVTVTDPDATPLNRFYRVRIE